ncbi:Splicing factor [Exophiala xenobiotica]|nr:Splicing factor [Exophiala xenobiotica]
MFSEPIRPQAANLLQIHHCRAPFCLLQAYQLIPVPSGPLSGHFSRSSSSQNIESLAELAAHQQTSRPTPPILSSSGSSESQKSSAGMFPHLSSAGATSNPRASFDINMVETPKQVLRADYTDTSLPTESQGRLTELVAYVQEMPSLYEVHREIIQILHQGFVDHIYPSSNPNAHRDPRTYELLSELRQARENFDKLFAVGEEQWLDWLQDESILAQTAEERVNIVDKCRRAVEEECGSARLWITYGDWVLHCYKWALEPATDLEGENGEAERLVGREVFDWKLVLDTWEEAVQSTKHDLAQSHEVWDKYMTVRFGDVGQNLSSADAAAALELFQARLHVPHAMWEETFQAFSTFISANFPTKYENIMSTTLKDSASAKALLVERDVYESALRQAQASGDQTSEYSTFDQYILFERNEEELAKKRRNAKGKRNTKVLQDLELDMVAALYCRSELRFPSVVAIWEAHLDYLVEKSKSGILPLLARATKHCPWSGSLWKQYLLASEIAEDEFDETEKIKHKATSTGLLDAAGVEQALIIYDAWCGYLLRRTKRADSTEEDADVAEMGIRSSIEAVHSLASKQGLGPDFDASFSLQRKYVEYLKSQGRFDNARAQFDDAVADFGKHHKFWLRFYEFELQKGVQMAFIQQGGNERLPTLWSAPFAVGVLKQGLQYPDLDKPEPLVEALLNHCEDYEDADELQNALSLVRKVQTKINEKKREEALQVESVVRDSQKAEEQVASRTEEVANGLHIGKRKREDDLQEPDSKKRNTNAVEMQQSVEESAPQQEQLKRDREHASILVQNLPDNVSETKVRQFFSSCGLVKHVKYLEDEHTAVVEFEDADAASFALSRDGREFEGSEISVVLNTGSTLYVTNYPAAADEAFIRNLLRPYGEIINVRFPSLQKNKRRRFCYVEFKLPGEAQAATELDNKEIEGLQIVAKISNPTVRHARTEKKDDGRKVFVGQLPFKATADDVEKLFAKYGKLENIRVPKDANARNRIRGVAFLTFESSEQAQAALAMNNQEFKGRKITVQRTEESGRTTKDPSRVSKSPSVQVAGETSVNSSDLSSIEDRQQRTVAICDVPDTVNESRIRAMAEKTGPVRKVLLKTNHQGALIEFETVADAGRAMIELDGHEIDPGRRIRVTTEKEMLQQKAEHKQEQFAKRPAPNRPTNTSAQGPVRRPMQPGARKGGHLGQRSAFLIQTEQKNGTDADVQTANGKKTNEDFRNLIKKG